MRSDSRRAALGRLASAGRSGLLAASLFGMATIGVACDDTEEPEGDATITAQPAYGIPADQIDPPNDTTPSDTGTTDTDDATAGDAATGDVTIEDAADTGPVAEYGIPPDATSDDMMIEDAADAGFEPEYGIAPDAVP